ncbi:preprotein translocase subunit SecE [bacterium]|nr:preprotein translocase subunit SecE [bacterium]
MANVIVRTREFLLEVGQELKRSSWPTRKELVDSTVVVIITVLILGVFIACVDWVLVRIIRLLTGTG